ncbi:MAG TPA: hypothetical protein VLE73_01830 [Candidatus Saccharimonadales bacterium]|nr:hypothetical protein [Candidatus Saccharimonadales bacterium]
MAETVISDASRPPSQLKLADERIVIDPVSRVVHADGSPLQIGGILFRLLATFAGEPDIAHSRTDLTGILYYGYTDTKAQLALTANIHRMRKILGPVLGDHETGAIRSVGRSGYMALSSLVDRPTNIEAHTKVLSIADNRVRIIPARWELLVDNQSMYAPPRDLDVLQFLAARPDKPHTAESIIDAFEIDSGTYYIRVIINRVRNKLGPELGSPDYGAVRTVARRSRAGYMAVSSLHIPVQTTFDTPTR